jgi:CBS domain-containing protein
MALTDGWRGSRAVTTGWSVVWTHGDGCSELAELLAAGEPKAADSDLRDACIRARADLLVAKKLTSFDLVGTAVPVDFDPMRVTEVVAAVGGGPHSAFGARIADRLAAVLDVPASLVYGSATDDRDGAAERTLAGLALVVPHLPGRVERVESARALVASLAPTALVVVGASGGSWLQRQFFGPGKQLVVGAPGGAVVARSAPDRCFQRMSEPEAVGVHMLVRDVLGVMTAASVPVVDDGLLIGVVRKRTLVGADPGSPVGPLVEDPVFVALDDPVDAVAEMIEHLDHGPVPVVDQDGRLVGLI